MTVGEWKQRIVCEMCGRVWAANVWMRLLNNVACPRCGAVGYHKEYTKTSEKIEKRKAETDDRNFRRYVFLQVTSGKLSKEDAKRMGVDIDEMQRRA